MESGTSPLSQLTTASVEREKFATACGAGDQQAYSLCEVQPASSVGSSEVAMLKLVTSFKDALREATPDYQRGVLKFEHDFYCVLDGLDDSTLSDFEKLWKQMTMHMQ